MSNEQKLETQLLMETREDVKQLSKQLTQMQLFVYGRVTLIASAISFLGNFVEYFQK